MDRNIVFCRLALTYSGLLENEINENQKENQRESFLIFVGFLFLLCQREPETDSVIGIGSRIGFA